MVNPVIVIILFLLSLIRVGNDKYLINSYLNDLIFKFNKKCEIPEILAENSGIILYDSLLWTFNDSGGDPILYALDTTEFSIKRRVNLIHSENIDWEDIAQNDSFIFIGDFGNNDGSRDNLKVYFIEKSVLTNRAEQEIKPRLIRFTYEDQNDFSPEMFATEFDCEAMVVPGDSIYLFTKDWINQSTSVYILPAAEGICIARLIGKFNTKGLITGADFKNNRLVLCGYTFEQVFVLFFSEFPEDNSFSRIDIPNSLNFQVEGVAIIDNSRLFLSNEKSAIPQAVHLLEIAP